MCMCIYTGSPITNFSMISASNCSIITFKPIINSFGIEIPHIVSWEYIFLACLLLIERFFFLYQFVCCLHRLFRIFMPSRKCQKKNEHEFLCSLQWTTANTRQICELWWWWCKLRAWKEWQSTNERVVGGGSLFGIFGKFALLIMCYHHYHRYYMPSITCRLDRLDFSVVHEVKNSLEHSCFNSSSMVTASHGLSNFPNTNTSIFHDCIAHWLYKHVAF